MVRLAIGAVIGAGAVLGAVAWTFADRPEPAPEPVVAEPVGSAGSSVLLAVEGPSGEAASVVLVASHPEERDRVLLFPPSLLLIQPGFGEHPLEQVLLLGDEDLLATSITNLLGIRVDDAVVIGGADLRSALGEPLEVDLAAPYVVLDSDVQRVVAAAGLEPRPAEMVYRLLTDQGVASEAEFLLRQGRTWEALVRRIGTDEDALAALGGTSSETVRRALVAASQDEDLVVAALPTTTAEAVGGTGPTQVVFDTAMTGEFVVSAFPYLQIAPEPRPVLEVLNGNGGVGVTAPIAERLARAGYRILKTDNADRTDFAVTQVVAHGRDNEETALAIQRLLGLGEVVLEIRQPSAVFDVTIIVGNDLGGS